MIYRRVFESVSSVYFTCAGRKYLVYVDRSSNWLVVVDCSRVDSTIRHLIKTLWRSFVKLEAPSRLRSNRGPQYPSRRTAEFFKRGNVNHRISSPEYPQKFGHAEINVKKIKLLLLKTTVNKNQDTDVFKRVL